MKRRLLKWLLFIVLVSAFLYVATWFYYSQKGLPKQIFYPSIVPVNKSSQLQWIAIHWVKNEFSDRSCMYIPVYLDTISKPFWMQFDLGTSITELYNISGYFPYFKQKETLPSQDPATSRNGFNYYNLNLRVGNSLIYHAEKIPILNQQADTLVETASAYEFKIGDLGYDLIKNRILIIDYRHSRIAITDSLNQEDEQNVNWFTNSLLNQMPMYLPISINGGKKYMQFDNGSSAFTFWTNVDQWNSWRDQNTKPDTFIGYSWGVKEYYMRAKSSVKIHFQGKDLTNFPIWAITKGVTGRKSFLQAIKTFTDKHFGKVFPGCIGNEYFRDEVVIFDTQHNRLGIQRNKDE